MLEFKDGRDDVRELLLVHSTKELVRGSVKVASLVLAKIIKINTAITDCLVLLAH